MRDVTDQLELREREIDMRLAASIQQRLFPKEAPELSGLDLAGAVTPAAATCGDYFDFIRSPSGTVVLTVGDVCGHGLGPAIVMAQTRAYVRSLVEAGHDLPTVLTMTNAHLYRDTADDLFVSLILVEVEAGSCRLRYANAGHPAGYLLAADGSIRYELTTTGPALGIFPHGAYQLGAECRMSAGEQLILLTDGATECRSPEGIFLGVEGLLEVARAHLDVDASGMIRYLQEAVRRLTGGAPPEDDVTLVVCRCT